MGRTKKDISVIGRTAQEVKAAVQNWFDLNKIKTIDNSESSIKGRWGSGFLTAAKYFQVSFTPTERGITAQTEGWISIYGLTEQDFKPSALNAGGIPRKEGWRVMEQLWSMLESLSKET